MPSQKMHDHEGTVKSTTDWGADDPVAAAVADVVQKLDE
jgi:hypothetical protein